MPSGKKIDWITLRAEYVMSDAKEVPDRTTFFRKKGIPDQTWKAKAKKEWDEERTAHIREAARRALSENMAERTKFLKDTASVGEALTTIGVDALVDRKSGQVQLKPKSAREAAELIKAGVEIQGKALQLQDTPEMRALMTLNLQVNNTVNNQVVFDGLDPATLRRVAKSIGRAKAGAGDAGLPDLGD